MFCNTCGAPIQPQFNVCPNCGQRISGNVVLTTQSRLSRHLRTLAILWMVAGALFLIPGLVMMTLSGVVRIAVPATEEIGRLIGPAVLSIIGGSLVLVAAGGILVGWGLMRHEGWARLLAIIIGILALFHPPFGTALGIYTLWVLLPQECATEYAQLAKAVT